MGSRFGKYGDIKIKAKLRRSKIKQYSIEKIKQYLKSKKKYKCLKLQNNNKFNIKDYPS